METYQPTNLFLVNMAAMGIVDDSVEPNSGLSPLEEGSWYGTTVQFVSPAFSFRFRAEGLAGVLALS